VATVIDSNYAANEKHTRAALEIKATAAASREKDNTSQSSARKGQPIIKGLLSMLNAERKECFTILLKLVDSSQAPLPIIEEACSILAKQLSVNPSLKFRDLIQDKITELSKDKTQN